MSDLYFNSISSTTHFGQHCWPLAGVKYLQNIPAIGVRENWPRIKSELLTSTYGGHTVVYRSQKMTFVQVAWRYCPPYERYPPPTDTLCLVSHWQWILQKKPSCRHSLGPSPTITLYSASAPNLPWSQKVTTVVATGVKPIFQLKDPCGYPYGYLYGSFGWNIGVGTFWLQGKG